MRRCTMTRLLLRSIIQGQRAYRTDCRSARSRPPQETAPGTPKRPCRFISPSQGPAPDSVEPPHLQHFQASGPHNLRYPAHGLRVSRVRTPQSPLFQWLAMPVLRMTRRGSHSRWRGSKRSLIYQDIAPTLRPLRLSTAGSETEHGLSELRPRPPTMIRTPG